MLRIAFSLAVFFSLTAAAQDYQVDLNYYLPSDVTYDPNIPTPESVIGHQVGDWHITHDKLAMYMQALAAASDRITIESRGTTFEGRPILLLTVTSPENHSRIDQIQAAHMALTDNGSGDTTQMPVIVYQGFSIHGNEPSGSNAALLYAYYLAAAQGPVIEEKLKNTVVLLDPSFNPDGLQRFAYWANVHKSININPDPNDREYSEVWPGGRTNHYWFDMNRDWLPVQLPESRARIESFHKWYPNVLTDHHEMGTNATFFFQPGIPSRTHPLTPQRNQDLTGEIAEFHVKALDQIGSLYYTEESFDDFYYGKGSTFPDINGGIGILFEQASSRGHAQESDNGILTFPFTIRNQLTAALSTLEASANMRTTLLDYQKQFFSDARNEASKGGAYIVGDPKDAARVYHFAEILDRHKIKFHELKNDVNVGGKSYKQGFSYIIPKNQKNHRLLNAMFDVRTTFKDSLFYDISAWTFPMAFNLNYSDKASLSAAGAEVTDLKPKETILTNTGGYAYLMEWHEYYSPKALNMILEEGIRAKVGMKPFTLGGKQYDYGTIMIPAQNQKLGPRDLAKFLNDVARESHIEITGVGTGYTQGIDLGSNQFRAIEKQEVALIIGNGMNPYDAGEIWHLFDTRYGMKITKIDTDDFGRADLSRYTDIIVPNSWGSALDKSDAEKLEDWIRDGGTLIAYKNMGRWLDRNELMKIEFKSEQDTATNISFEQRSNYFGAQVIGGAIFNTKLDLSHPIAFGYTKDNMPTFRNSTLFMEADAQSYNNPVQYTENPLLSGYISEENLELLGGTSMVKIQGKGRGQIIYFTDNTNFRAFWYGTNKLLMNAIFFGDEM
ncbi:M14 family metallopeptidase [Gilvibacter sediminis]|uniref:M14 family metallopeptidase n=1 Tax=Gilvibacter sediminis TaxID=379071 RepID=UPI0023502A57|nr:M14 family metallopeptidase [Gilvibacter sediminis]MDC7999229.1 M14 family metallopeptidase [Gilvibacter sediminis]